MQIKLSEEKKAEFLGKGNSRAGYSLQLLGTDPKYQKNGAGTALVRYGLEKVFVPFIHLRQNDSLAEMILSTIGESPGCPCKRRDCRRAEREYHSLP